jgi:phage antirepressor YoqD-like protein
MNEVTRFLVDKKYLIKDGEEYYRLYFYDSMDGVIVTIDAPVVKNRMAVEQERIEEQGEEISEQVQEDVETGSDSDDLLPKVL